MSYLRVKEVKINRTEGYQYGDSGYYEPGITDIPKLFRSLQKEYGRCISKVYIDIRKGSAPIGWVFQKMMKYDDCNKMFLQEVWVTLAITSATGLYTPIYIDRKHAF